MRSYPIICPSCNGTGRLGEVGYTANTTRVCPACNGTGTVICNEVTPEDGGLR